MKYSFPDIRNLSDVLPAIKDADEFIVAQREGYQIVNYLVNKPDTFPPVTDIHSAIRRECRGMVFDDKGEILHRRLHKFFNVNERAETLYEEIDLSQPHWILEKLDGSMITPLVLEHGIRWATKMGVTDVSMQAEVFVVHHPQYIALAEELSAMGVTPTFEWCSRKNRIVVDHPEDRLVLLTMRHNISGKYVPYHIVADFAKRYFIEVVQRYPGTVESMESLVTNIREETVGEGWIIVFKDGHMVKIKNEAYVLMHKVKDRVRYERNLVAALINAEIDDLKAFMAVEDFQRVEEYESQFWTDVDTYTQSIYMFIDTAITHYTRKEFAVGVAPTLPDRFPVQIAYRLWDNPLTYQDVRQEVLKMITNRLGSNKKFEELRPILINCKWNENEE